MYENKSLIKMELPWNKKVIYEEKEKLKEA